MRSHTIMQIIVLTNFNSSQFSGSTYVLYLLYLLVRAFAELRSLPYFDLRLRFLTVLAIFVLGVSVAVFVLRWDSDRFTYIIYYTEYRSQLLHLWSRSLCIFLIRFGTSVLQDNFVAELSFTYKNSAEFLTFYRYEYYKEKKTLTLAPRIFF